MTETAGAGADPNPNQFSSTFDRNSHVPYRLDGAGLNREMSIKDLQRTKTNVGEFRIPTWWKKVSESTEVRPNHTNLELQQKRRRANLPDLTFDLDGDGVVGERDMIISKMFDKDKDGRLNTSERQSAENAIKNVSDIKIILSII